MPGLSKKYDTNHDLGRIDNDSMIAVTFPSPHRNGNKLVPRDPIIYLFIWFSISLLANPCLVLKKPCNLAPKQ